MQETTHNPSAVDWARLAAFIDGEGCISLRRNARNSGTVSIAIANTDARLLVWLKQTFGVGNIWARRHAKYAKRTLYSWDVSGKVAIAILEGCYNFLIIKREQADLAFEFHALSGQSYKGPGVKTSVEVQNKRDELRSRLFIVKREAHPLEVA